MKSKELLFWIWLSEALPAGSPAFRRLIELYDNPYELFDADEAEIERISELTERVKQKLCDKNLSHAAEILSACEQEDVGVLTWGDPRYPDLLREIKNPPVLLYYRGELPDFAKTLCIGMVGTRRMSAYGMRAAYKIAYELAAMNVLVVSGMAAGIDGVCGAAALAAKGGTVAVLGCGIDVVYPAHHKNLYGQIARNGLILSEYPPGTRPNSYHFPMRNRIISGLSRATVVVEAGLGSGSLITAREAILQGRDVFALPANVGNEGAEGTNGLLRDGARLALNALDVMTPYEILYPQTVFRERLEKAQKASDPDLWFLQQMGVIASDEQAPAEQTETPVRMPSKKRERGAEYPRCAEKQAPHREEQREQKTEPQASKCTPDQVISSLTPVQLAIMETIPDDRAIAVDAICAVDFPHGEVIAALTMLEIMGLIQKLPGALYKKA